MERLNFTHPIHLAVGLTLWSVWFVAVYSGLSVACAVTPPPPEAGALNSTRGDSASMRWYPVGSTCSRPLGWRLRGCRS